MQTVLITGEVVSLAKILPGSWSKAVTGLSFLAGRWKEKKIPTRVSYALWDLKILFDPAAISAADYIIHLAGAGVVDKKWTDAYKQEILESRTEQQTHRSPAKPTSSRKGNCQRIGNRLVRTK